MQKPMVSIIFMVFMGFAFLQTEAHSAIRRKQFTLVVVDTCISSDTMQLQVFYENDSIVHASVTKKEMRKKRAVTSILALPFPFGFIGAHRVMLGCKPWVPVVYVATLGGCFGILPLIDFFVLAFSKDIFQYENNSHIFMWLK